MPTASSTSAEVCLPAPFFDLVGVGEGRQYVVDVVADVQQTLACVNQLIRLRRLRRVRVTEVLQRPLHGSHTILALDIRNIIALDTAVTAPPTQCHST